LKTKIKEIGECPHYNCGGKKVQETISYRENPYPPTQVILGPGGKNQMISKSKILIYCTKCFSIFKQ